MSIALEKLLPAAVGGRGIHAVDLWPTAYLFSCSVCAKQFQIDGLFSFLFSLPHLITSNNQPTNEPLKRGCRTMQGVVEQYDAADRPRLQYIFYGLLFYQSKLLTALIRYEACWRVSIQMVDRLMMARSFVCCLNEISSSPLATNCGSCWRCTLSSTISRYHLPLCPSIWTGPGSVSCVVVAICFCVCSWLSSDDVIVNCGVSSPL